MADNINDWLITSMSSWSLDRVLALRLTATVFAACAAYRWYVSQYHTRYIKPNPHLKNQSVIVNSGNGLRASVVANAFMNLGDLVTYYDLFSRGVNVSRHKPCLGRRHSFTDPIEWWTYEEVDSRICAVGSGLTHLCHEASVDDHLIVGIYGKNSPEWVVTLFACSAYGLVSLPLYDTLGTEAMEHICHEATPVAVVCETVELAANIITWTQGSVSHIIVIKRDTSLHQFRQSCTASTNILSFDELIAIGRQHMQPVEHKSDPDDLCIIGYTSGSTGLPKGVKFSHKNCLLSAIGGIYIFRDAQMDVDQPVHFSYLPLAHCYERINVATLLHEGGRIGFLTEDVSCLLNDLRDYKPVCFATVPRVLIRIYNRVLLRISYSKVLLALFRWAIRQKLADQRRGIYRQAGLLDRLFFRPVRELAGGRVQIVISASAPVSEEVLDFVRAAFSCPVVECYGLTETSGILSATLIGEMDAGHTGTPFLDFQIKLVDVPEMNLLVSHVGIGEICAKGEGCTSGYYKDQVNTEALFDEDGFIRTGDIGTWTSFGALKVVDRRKSFFKLSQGEYVTPKKVEEVYTSSLLVEHVFVDGDSRRSFLIAIVAPNLAELRKRLVTWCSDGTFNSLRLPRGQRLPTPDLNDTELCAHPLVSQLVLNELTQIGKSGGLKGFEQAKALHLSAEPFTVSSGLLTPTMKISRPIVRRHFAAIIKQLYSKHRD